MARPMDTLPTSLEASPFGLSIQRGKKRSRFSCLDYSGGPRQIHASVILDWPCGWELVRSQWGQKPKLPCVVLLLFRLRLEY